MSVYPTRLTDKEYAGVTPTMMMLNVIDAAMSALSEGDRGRVARVFANKYSNYVSPPGSPDLTPMQWRVLRCLADGLSTEEIQNHLYVSRRSVSSHLEQIIDKLGAANRTHAVAEAFRKGML